MITIKRAVFQQLAAQVHTGLHGVAAQVLENDTIQIVEGDKVVEEFSAADALEVLLRWGEQVPVPAMADCDKMVKNASIKNVAKAPNAETRKKGNV